MASCSVVRKHSVSHYNNYLLIGPNRENIISRSSSVVTGFSLQTNSTFSGGLTSASGKSPTCGGQKQAFIISVHKFQFIQLNKDEKLKSHNFVQKGRREPALTPAQRQHLLTVHTTLMYATSGQNSHIKTSNLSSRGKYK